MKVRAVLFFFIFASFLAAAEDTETMLARARALTGESRIQEAVTVLELAEISAPENKKMMIYLELGVNLRKAGKYKECIEYYNKAAKLSPKMADIYYNIGLAYYYQRQFKQAITYCLKAIDLSPKYTEAFGAMAMAYRDFGLSDMAVKTIKKAIEIDPNYAGGYNILANCYEDRGWHNEAIEMYRRAIILRPDYAFYNLGVVLDETGQYEGAVDAYNQALKLDKNADTYYNLGQSYMGSRSYYNAQDAFKESIKINNSNEDAYKYLVISLNEAGMKREAVYWEQQKNSRFGR
jgi:protein arginine N-methyltransferase 7